MRHLDDEHVGLQVSYFDPAEEVPGSSFAILHLLVLMQDSLAAMFGGLFDTAERMDMGLATFEDELGDRLLQYLEGHPEMRAFVEEFGLWTDVT